MNTIELPRTRFGFKRLLKKNEFTDKKILDSVGKLRPFKRKYLFLMEMLKKNERLVYDVLNELNKDKGRFEEGYRILGFTRVKAIIRVYEEVAKVLGIEVKDMDDKLQLYGLKNNLFRNLIKWRFIPLGLYANIITSFSPLTKLGKGMLLGIFLAAVYEGYVGIRYTAGDTLINIKRRFKQKI